MTEAPPNIRAVIWDLGGVLVRTEDWTPRARWEQRLGLEPGALSRLVFEGEASRRASIGQADTADVWQWVGRRLGIPEEEWPLLERDFWSGDSVDMEIIAFIRGLRPRLATGLLSNAWPSLRQALEEHWRIADAFDHIVISAEAGMVKPDPRIYHLALQGLGVAPEEAIFIDDFIENVEGARAVGMHAVHFRSSEQALEEVRALLDNTSAGA